MYLRDQSRRRRGRALRMVRPPAWYRQMQGVPLGSLGDDGASAEPTVSDAEFTRQWQQQMMDAQNRLVASADRYVRQEKIQKALQLAATLAIPLSAVVWKHLFQWWKGRKVGPSSGLL